ncbi:MAG: diguanylate cyclase [Oscillospiraceae bacterium]|nr:diguanylate cyclase [Oscillospiraceae bacterium]
MRKNVEDSVCEFKDLKIKVTMSFGVTQLSPSKSIEENIKAADEKLYHAKESGRNRVVK